MTSLLATMPDRAYPLEFIHARIRGKRAHLITDWKLLVETGLPSEQLPAGGAEAAVWPLFLDEMVWLWSRMDSAMRKLFCPVFQYFELRTIVICLRSAANRHGTVPEAMLRHSMLSKEAKGVLTERGLIGEKLDSLERELRFISPEFRHLKQTLEREKMAGVERQIYSLFLAHANRESRDPGIRSFFIRLTDMANVMTLFRRVRWRESGIPRFISGGKLTAAALEQCARENDMESVLMLAGRIADSAVPAGLENALFREMSRHLRLRSRETDGTGLVLQYIWKCFMQARNLGLLMAGYGLERDLLERELVL